MEFSIGLTFPTYSDEAASWARENRAQLVFDAEKMLYKLVPDGVDDASYVESASDQIRSKRNALLSETDFYFMPDYPISDEELTALKAYRQALRDITMQAGFPFVVEWPTIPQLRLVGFSGQ